MSFSRRDFAFTAAFAAFCGSSAMAQNSAMKAPPSPPRRATLTIAQREDLARVSAYLNGIGTLAADFSQINPNGSVTQGVFYLSRPGKLRFEYKPPTPTLIVATGGKVHVRNSRLNTLQSYSIDDTPLGLLLSPDIDLQRNPAVLGIERILGADGQLDGFTVRARSSTNRMQDNISISFAARPTFEIRQWMVRDAQGGMTTVGLSQLRTDVDLPDSLFAVPVPARSIRKGGG